jgi:2,4-dienoyl-CoA reductase-like NADH-dependent reductase (Old Yellow Enzyme family)
MSKLFETTTIKSMELDNRFVRSATALGEAADDGACTSSIIHRMVELARGGVGLIITGHAYVDKVGQAGAKQLGCHDDSMLPGLTEMAQAVHDADGKIALQIAHAGLLASIEQTGQEPLGPSPLQTENGPAGRAMTVGELDDMAAAFASAASRAMQAGYDAVQIHSAHGYGLGQFISPFFNKRTDEYGGSLESRARVLVRVVAAVRGAVGERYPVLLKINAVDRLDGGLCKEETVQVCAMLQQAGVDAIEFSGGTTYALRQGLIEQTFAPTKKKNVYYRDAAELYKTQVDVPLMLVGGIRSFETSEELVEDGIADYVSFCRPLIREPGLVNRWKAGDRRKSGCTSDNLCGYASMQGKGLHCVHLKQ